MLQPMLMHRFNVILHQDFRDSVIKELHKSGITEIEFLGEKEISDFKIKRGHPLEKNSVVARNLIRLNRVIGMLKRFDVSKTSFLEEMLGIEKINKEQRRDLSFNELNKQVEKVLEIENDVARISDRIEECDRMKAEIEKNLDELNLLPREIRAENIGEGKFVQTFALSVSGDENVDKLKKEVNKINAYVGVYEISKTKKLSVYTVIIAVTNKDASTVKQIISKLGLRTLKVQGGTGTVADIISKLNKQLNELNTEKESLIKKLKEIFDSNYKELLICKELLDIEKERCEIFVNGGRTGKTVYLRMFVPAMFSDKIKKKIEEKSENFCEITIEKDLKEAPTIMDNPRIVKKFQFLTEIYGMPKYKHIDPTLFVVPFMIFFIGLMIADAAYGAILIVLAGVLYKKYSKYSEGIKNMMLLTMLCGAVAICVGVVNGDYFGNLVHDWYAVNIDHDAISEYMLVHGVSEQKAIQEYKLPMQMFHPEGADLSLFLQFAVCIGAFHIWLGTVLGFFDAIRRKHLKEGIFKYFSWMLFGLGMMILFFGMLGKIFGFPIILFPDIVFAYIAAGLILIGAIISMIHEPILTPIEAIDYFAFILSYARIMALLVAAGAVASAFNQLASMAWGVAFGVIAVLIFIAGQTLHFALGVLSGFVQALRLMYVEHFSRYYEGGGIRFKAFEEKRKYTEPI